MTVACLTLDILAFTRGNNMRFYLSIKRLQLYLQPPSRIRQVLGGGVGKPTLFEDGTPVQGAWVVQRGG